MADRNSDNGFSTNRLAAIREGSNRFAADVAAQRERSPELFEGTDSDVLDDFDLFAKAE